MKILSTLFCLAISCGAFAQDSHYENAVINRSLKTEQKPSVGIVTKLILPTDYKEPERQASAKKEPAPVLKTSTAPKRDVIRVAEHF
ncbi:MAG: hypothetical protein KBD63_05170 [Bacteriovoracaceae bacterium]|nr:hypothetical protein [Bacteriovoracaceae bacterium]